MCIRDSGRAVLWVWHLMRHGGAEQIAISFSSGKSKHYATIRTMAYTSIIRSKLTERGVQRDVRVV
eukprot:5220083-Heterocapsa_arctica.AAC.1